MYIRIKNVFYFRRKKQTYSLYILRNLHYVKLHYHSLIKFYYIVIINAYTEYISEDFHSSDNKIRNIIRHISADWGINFVEYEDDIRPLWAIKDAVDFLYHS